jgi:hypothetical protein
VSDMEEIIYEQIGTGRDGIPLFGLAGEMPEAERPRRYGWRVWLLLLGMQALGIFMTLYKSEIARLLEWAF